MDLQWTMGKDENSILDVIHKALSKDKDIEKRNKAIVNGVLNGLIALMREKDPLFALLFKRSLRGSIRTCTLLGQGSVLSLTTT